MRRIARLVLIVFTVLRFGVDEVALRSFRQRWVRVLARIVTRAWADAGLPQQFGRGTPRRRFIAQRIERELDAAARSGHLDVRFVLVTRASAGATPGAVTRTTCGPDAVGRQSRRNRPSPSLKVICVSKSFICVAWTSSPDAGRPPSPRVDASAGPADARKAIGFDEDAFVVRATAAEKLFSEPRPDVLALAERALRSAALRLGGRVGSRR